MSTHTEPTTQDYEHTRKARSQMTHLRALWDAATDPEVRADIQGEMNCVAMALQRREMFDDDAEPLNNQPLQQDDPATCHSKITGTATSTPN